MMEKQDMQSGEATTEMSMDATFPIYFSERTVRVGKIDFQVASHYCGWEGIERRLGALMLEDIFGGEEEEINDADR